MSTINFCLCFSSISELYFKLEMLRSWSGKANQSISNFEKIRTVGKGWFLTRSSYRFTLISIGVFHVPLSVLTRSGKFRRDEGFEEGQ